MAKPPASKKSAPPSKKSTPKPAAPKKAAGSVAPARKAAPAKKAPAASTKPAKPVKAAAPPKAKAPVKTPAKAESQPATPTPTDTVLTDKQQRFVDEYMVDKCARLGRKKHFVTCYWIQMQRQNSARLLSGACRS